MTTRRRLGIAVYAPALTNSDGRVLAVIQGMERALLGLRLEWKVSEDGHPIALPARDTWLAEEMRDGGFPLVCNGDERYPVMVHGLQTPGSQAPGGQPMLDVHAKLPLDEAMTAVAPGVLEGVAEGARAYWGHATPSKAAAQIAGQTVDPVHKPGVPPRGLPVLKFPERIRSPEIPHRLGWLNYWSAAAARAIGFPDASRDAELLTRARGTPSGGWVVQLTDAPLDLDDPAHLDVLLRTYERFPEIGGRSVP
ncbi:hypothetical protein HUA74_10560 [Myxococcus sp. CA051A]|uniref:DUF5953 family protein n=1 Tax=unclassified Myxococcus TaxID=2648731 RepID=UPI00157AFF62|nr:hypothetical protein [Myxococcus sp. CA033]NTX53857.1 hypothetical protein [Myxococcus sp. CA039A]NTX61104.1 hypothetical protein [Myxococcus sp. CA051A]